MKKKFDYISFIGALIFMALMYVFSFLLRFWHGETMF